MRALTRDEVSRCATGCSLVRETDQGLHLLRFTEPNLAYWDELGKTDEGAAIRAHCSAGVVLDFTTDSVSLTIATRIGRAARVGAALDVWVDGAMVGYAGTPEAGETLEGTVTLGDPSAARRHVRLHLPHTRECFLREVSLDDGASFAPAAPTEDPLLLCLGDSITQGMDALHPSLTYTSTAARELGMRQLNNAIGGWRFVAESLVAPPVEAPDLITVALGTNDWSSGASAAEAGPYLRRLRDWYPDAPLGVLEPVWRDPADLPEGAANPAGQRMPDYRSELRQIVAAVPGAHLVPMRSLLPVGPLMLVDGVHPNTLGHVLYGQNLAHWLRSAGLAPA